MNRTMSSRPRFYHGREQSGAKTLLLWLLFVLVAARVVTLFALWGCPTFLRWLIAEGYWDTYAFWWTVFVQWGCVIPR